MKLEQSRLIAGLKEEGNENDTLLQTVKRTREAAGRKQVGKLKDALDSKRREADALNLNVASLKQTMKDQHGFQTKLRTTNTQMKQHADDLRSSQKALEEERVERIGECRRIQDEVANRSTRLVAQLRRRTKIDTSLLHRRRSRRTCKWS